VVRHAVTSHRQISGNAVTSAFTAIHPVLNRNQRRYHVKTTRLNLYRKIIAVLRNVTHINESCGQKVKFLSVKPRGT
jgi:hypothetical protein